MYKREVINIYTLRKYTNTCNCIHLSRYREGLEGYWNACTQMEHIVIDKTKKNMMPSYYPMTIISSLHCGWIAGHIRLHLKLNIRPNNFAPWAHHITQHWHVVVKDGPKFSYGRLRKIYRWLIRSILWVGGGGGAISPSTSDQNFG